MNSEFNFCCQVCIPSDIFPSGYCKFLSPDSLAQCDFDEIYYHVLSIDQCNSYVQSIKDVILDLSSTYCYPMTTEAPGTTAAHSTPTSIIQIIEQNAPTVITATVGIGAIGFLVQPPPLPALTPQGVPPGNPLPGAIGGGASPVAISPQAATALGLAPLGAVPIALFPPYATPRTLPAISVIFSESPSVMVQAQRRLTTNVARFTSRGETFIAS